jgi:hypothetical protein
MTVLRRETIQYSKLVRITLRNAKEISQRSIDSPNEKGPEATALLSPYQE